MSASLTSAIAKKSPKSLLEQSAEAVLKDCLAQGKAPWIFKELRKSEAGKAVLEEAYPKPVEVFYMFLKGPDSVHDDTEGLILASKAPWLKILCKEHKRFNKPRLCRGSLGGFKFCWDEKGEAVEWASELISQLSKEDITKVVGKGLGLTVDFRHNPDDEDEGEEEDEDSEYNPGEWFQNNVEAIEEALDTKFGELFAYNTELVSPGMIMEWEKLNRKYNVLGSFHIEVTNWE